LNNIRFHRSFTLHAFAAGSGEDVTTESAAISTSSSEQSVETVTSHMAG